MKNADSLTCETSKWAKDWDVSSQTIRNWLKFFKERKLIKIIGGGRGRGRKWIIKFTSWVKKKVKLAGRGIKSLTKKRLDELERKYFKSLSWTGENPKKPNNVFKHSINKHTLRDNQDNFHKNQKSSTSWKSFRSNLKDLDDQTILGGQGEKNFDQFMAMLRKWLWQEHSVDRNLDDIICNAIGSLIKHKPFSFAVRVWNRLGDNISKLLSLLKTAVTKTGIYAKIRSLFSSSASKGQHTSKSKHTSNSLPSYVKGNTYDLNTVEGRQKYEATLKELFKETYRDVIKCPRCDKQLTKEIFENPLKHYDEKRCICVFISRDRALKHREEQDTRKGF